MAFWYFLSYATPDLDRQLRKFHADLSTALTKAVRVKKEDAGFIAGDAIQAGDLWEPTLSEALRTSKVLVSILSPAYLESEYCGKELQVCLDRHTNLGGNSTSIFPVIWGQPSASLHASVEKFQYTDNDFPLSYKEDGLWSLSRLKKRDYELFVSKLALKLAQAGSDHPLPAPRFLNPLKSVPNPFRFAQPRGKTSRQKTANFAFVAANPQEFAAHRRTVDRYGEGGKDWRPFQPNSDDPVGIVALQAAAIQRMYFNEVKIDQNFMAKVEEASTNHEPTIVVVDPWTVRLQSYRDLMKSYDYINPDYNAVLITWNSPDSETEQQREALKSELQQALKNIPKTRLFYRDSIDSIEQLQDALAKALAEVRGNLIKSNDAAQEIVNPAIAEKAQALGIVTNRQQIVAGPGTSVP